MVAKSVALLGLFSLIAPSAAEPTLVRRSVTEKVARDSCSKSITINPGDTCLAIASANGISLGQLLSCNTGINKGCTNLVAGESICITCSAKAEPGSKPSPSPTPAPGQGKCQKTIKIEPGNTCWGLANANHISLEQLNSLNPWINSACNNLIAGNDICVGGDGSGGSEPSKPVSKPGNCKKTVKIEPGNTCSVIAQANHLSLDQLNKLNPWINSACNNLIAGGDICVSGSGSDAVKPATPTTEAATPTTAPSKPGKCSKTYVVKGGDSCWSISQANGITVDQFTSLNSGISSGCTNLYAGDTVCVAAGGSEPAEPTTDAKPAPTTAPSKPGNCQKTYVVQGGDSCWSIAQANGITVDQFTTLNSGISSGCTNLYAGDTVCVAGGDSKPAPPATKPGDCKKTYVLQGGDSCSAVAQANGISVEQFKSWNSGISDGCTNLYAGDTVCVSK